MQIIAESASNHNGNLKYLKKLAFSAKNAGADFFTVQIINLNGFCDANYSRRKIVESILLSTEEWQDLFTYCSSIKMKIIPCPLDLPSLKIVLNKEFPLIKIHATDILNFPFLEELNKCDIKVLLETQCATLRDIQIAIKIIGIKRIDSIIHGYSNYPTEGSDQNLGALGDLRNRFKLAVGYADHTLDQKETPLMALAMGSKYLEKHITISRNDRRYDWQVSLEPEEFTIMVETIKKYSKTIGKSLKHPEPSEILFRSVLYKKYFYSESGLKTKRGDAGFSYYQHKYISYSKKKVVGAIVARLKSKRLLNKVFLPFHNDLLIFDLCRRIMVSKHLSSITIATSNLQEDSQIHTEGIKRGIKVYRGDPLIVIQRMLEICERNKAAAVFRITGDNPFTDPSLIDKMTDLFWSNELDYVRTGNVPLGVSAELYSISYLQKLYQKMKDPRKSEYLTWFVMQDKNAKKGVVNVKFRNRSFDFLSLTIDFLSDYERSQQLLKEINIKEFSKVSLTKILEKTPPSGGLNPKAKLKLPDSKSITFENFISMQKNQGYVLEEDFILS